MRFWGTIGKKCFTCEELHTNCIYCSSSGNCEEYASCDNETYYRTLDRLSCVSTCYLDSESFFTLFLNLFIRCLQWRWLTLWEMLFRMFRILRWLWRSRLHLLKCYYVNKNALQSNIILSRFWDNWWKFIIKETCFTNFVINRKFERIGHYFI